MAATRRNILTSAVDRDRYIQGVLALKAESAGVSTTDLGIGGGPRATERDLSTWDLFVIWHVWAMQQVSSDGRRNAAHMGSVFLPWHRWYLLVLEAQFQRVLGVGRDDFGLPWWDWAADGDLPPAQQRTAPLWSIIGGNGTGPTGDVADGPFGAATAFDIAIEQGPGGGLRATRRPLRRSLGTAVATLPTTDDVDAALADGVYDRPGYDASATGFRNLLEGWIPSFRAPALHNRVHVWVGGDMAPGSSPNDPVFFLNHCNVDRIWDRWQRQNPAATYQPPGRSPTTTDPLYRHRALDPIYSALTRTSPQVGALWDMSPLAVYE